MASPHHIVVLVIAPIEELDLVGPVQVLSTATRLLERGGTPYEIRVVSTTPDGLTAGQSGLAIQAQGHDRDLEGEIDSLLLVSGVKTPTGGTRSWPPGCDTRCRGAAASGRSASRPSCWRVPGC